MMIINVVNCDDITECNSIVSSKEFSSTMETLIKEFPPEEDYTITVKRALSSLVLSGRLRLDNLGNEVHVRRNGVFTYEDIPIVIQWLQNLLK